MKPILIIGGGGHAKVLISILKELQYDIIGILEKDEEKVGIHRLDVKVLGTDEMIGQFSPHKVMLVNGIGSISSTFNRADTYERFKKMGFSFLTIIHPKAFIANGVKISEGSQIMAGAIIQTGTKIGVNAIVNTGSIIEHDCLIGDHVHIAPGVVVSGGVKIGARTHIGSSATIIQGINIGINCLIGAGAVVITDVPDNSKAYGVPAKIIGEHNG